MMSFFGETVNIKVGMYIPGDILRGDVIVRELPYDYFTNGIYEADSLINGARSEYMAEFKRAVGSFTTVLSSDYMIVTGAYSFKAREMLHIVTPTYIEGDDILEYYDVLEELYFHIFATLLDAAYKKVSIFILGLGTWGLKDDYTTIQLAKYTASKYKNEFENLTFYVHNTHQFRLAANH